MIALFKYIYQKLFVPNDVGSSTITNVDNEASQSTADVYSGSEDVNFQAPDNLGNLDNACELSESSLLQCVTSPSPISEYNDYAGNHGYNEYKIAYDLGIDMHLAADNLTVDFNKCYARYTEANISHKLWYKELHQPMKRVDEVGNKYVLTELSPNTEYDIFIVEYTNNLEKRILHFSVRTAFCDPPTNFQILEGHGNTHELIWEAPNIGGSQEVIAGYTVCISDCASGECKEMMHCGANVTNLTVDVDLNLSYSITINALSENGREGAKAYIQNSHLRYVKKEECKNVEIRGNNEFFLLNLQDAATHSKYVNVKDMGKPKYDGQGENNIVVLLVGATGAGKTTWINAFVNFVMGVRRKDSFRFKLIKEDGDARRSRSQTSQVTIYNLHHEDGMNINCNVTLIDTPGFANTEGIVHDKQILHGLSCLFKEGYVDHIDAVAFVIPASLPRLTLTQRYVLDSMMALFGKDIEDNIILFFTFSDMQPPGALSAVDSHAIRYSKYLLFNNTAIIDYDIASEDTNIDHMNAVIWDQVMDNFRNVMDTVSELGRITTLQTKDVLLHREILQLLLPALRRSIEDAHIKLEQLKTEEEIMELICEDGNCSDINTYEIKTVKYERTPDTDKRIHTTCMKCNMTCHENCPVPTNEDLHQCVVIDQNGNCRICADKCPLWKHRHERYTFKRKIVTKTVDIQEIQNRQQPADEYEHSYEEVFEKICLDLNGVTCQIKSYLSEINSSLETLSDIALISWPKSEIDYINQLIVTEEERAADGYQSRVQILKQLHKEVNDLAAIETGDFEPFTKYKVAVEEDQRGGQSFKYHEIWTEIATMA